MKSMFSLFAFFVILTISSCQEQTATISDLGVTSKMDATYTLQPQTIFLDDDTELNVDAEPMPNIVFKKSLGNDDGRQVRSEIFMEVISEEMLEKYFPAIKEQHLPDFNNNIVFVYSIGQQSTVDCYAADVYDVFYTGDNTIRITLDYIEPSPLEGEGCKCDLAESSPYVVIEIPRSELSKIIPDLQYQYIVERIPSYKNCQ